MRERGAEKKKNVTVQIQQRAERDAAIARLEQSRIVLAMRLSEHHGKKYKVIEEALAFVGDVRDASHFAFPGNNLYGSADGTGEAHKGNVLVKLLLSSFNFAKSSLRLDQVGGVLGNAALVAVTMMLLFNFNQATTPKDLGRWNDIYGGGEGSKRPSSKLLPDRMLSKGSSGQLDVLLARG